MKKVIISSLLLIITLIVGWQIYSWRNINPRNPEIPQQMGEQPNTPSPTSQPDNDDQVNEIRVFDILGKSDNLTPQQWAAMQEWRRDVKFIAAENTKILFINGQGAQPQVALTFDDGPDDIITPKVVDVLKHYNVSATFFFKANQLNRYQEIVKEVYTEGNQIASHAYSHQELDKMSSEEIDKEIVASDKAFERVLGVKPAMLRPPFGAINQDVLNICQQKQEKVILWSIDTLDWSQPEPEHIARNVLDNVRPGDIILMHSCKDREATVQALPLIIEGLQAKGYQMVDLSALLQIAAYKR